MSEETSLIERARTAAVVFVISFVESMDRSTESIENQLSGILSSGLVADTRGQMAGGTQGGARKAVNVVVALLVGGLLAAFLLPIAIDEIEAVDTSTWGDGATALWDILPVMIVLAIFLFFTFMAVNRS